MTGVAELLGTARMLRDAGRAHEAADHFARAQAQAPAEPTLAAEHAMLRLRAGDLRGAVLVAEAAVANDPFAPALLSLHRAIGLALHAAWMWEDATPWLERAAAIEPWDTALPALASQGRDRPWIAPTVFDPGLGRTLRRYPAREGEAYIYVVEITGTCNLRCPTCPVGNSPRGARPLGFMEFDLFERVIAKIKRESPGPSPIINLFNWGEPLLHPELPRIIRHLRAEGLRSHLSTNLNIRKGLEAAIEADPDDLKLSLSGFTQATYGRTHARGDIELVKRNMHELRRLLDRHKARTNVWVGHHLYRSNLAEADAMRAFAAELGFAYHPIQAFYMPLERLAETLDGNTNEADGGIIADLLVPPAERQAHIAARRSGRFDCELRFNQTVINHDGNVALCCSVYDAGNMLGVNFLDEDFAAIEARKYRHPFCGACMARKLEYTRPELFPER